jgi:ABC-type Zn uptake system ZnuABC Zn-binding protein ZnuA
MSNSDRILQKAKLKVTPKRIAILDILGNEPNYVSPEDVWQKMKQKFSRIGLPTVYRNLENLSIRGVITKIIHPNRQLYYYLCTNKRHHHHFICLSCKRVEELEIWLDFSNAQTMVENILNGFIAEDPAHKDAYVRNAAAYSEKLAGLDKRFREGLSHCRTNTFIHGGHFAFGYLSKRYHLQYISAYKGFAPDAEPTPGRLKELVENMRRHHLKYVFYEELISPRVADTIAKETGAKLLQLHAAHNLTKEEWNQGVTFLSLMEKTLNNLKTGLECR